MRKIKIGIIITINCLVLSACGNKNTNKEIKTSIEARTDQKELDDNNEITTEITETEKTFDDYINELYGKELEEAKNYIEEILTLDVSDYEGEVCSEEKYYNLNIQQDKPRLYAKKYYQFDIQQNKPKLYGIEWSKIKLYYTVDTSLIYKIGLEQGDGKDDNRNEGDYDKVKREITSIYGKLENESVYEGNARYRRTTKDVCKNDTKVGNIKIMWAHASHSGDENHCILEFVDPLMEAENNMVINDLLAGHTWGESVNQTLAIGCPDCILGDIPLLNVKGKGDWLESANVMEYAVYGYGNGLEGVLYIVDEDYLSELKDRFDEIYGDLTKQSINDGYEEYQWASLSGEGVILNWSERKGYITVKYWNDL